MPMTVQVRGGVRGQCEGRGACQRQGGPQRSPQGWLLGQTQGNPLQVPDLSFKQLETHTPLLRIH